MKYKNVVISGIVLLLTSCTRYIDWGKKTFRQVDKIEYDASLVTSYIRKGYLYDQFNTVTLCDVLWLSPQVRNAYVDLYVLRRATTEKAEQLMRKRQQDEEKQLWSFYVVMTPRTDSDILFSMTDSQAIWTPTLRVDDGKELQAYTIKRVDLEPEYRTFFGNAATRYRIPYVITFKRAQKKACNLQLIIRSLQYEMNYTWDYADS